MGAKDFENVTSEELKHYQQAHKEKEYRLIDVRQPDEYSDGHIPGALLWPLDELEDRVSELPQEQDIVFTAAVARDPKRRPLSPWMKTRHCKKYII